MIWIPGWKFKVKKENLKRYRISLDYPMSIESLRFYIRKGEYSIDFPFSIFQNKNKDFGIILRDIDDVKNYSFLISSNLIIIGVEISEEWSNRQLKSLDLFIKSYMEDLIVKNSNGVYTPANEVRSCLRKYSKGRISKRAEPVDSIDSDYPYKTKYDLCEAEEFGSINLGKEVFLLTYIPRYEIRDSIINFPQNELIKEEINKKWEAFYYHTKKKFQFRFNYISDILIKLLINDKYVKLIGDKSLFQEEILNYPIFKFLISNREKPFKNLLKQEILSRMDEKLSLRIIIDKTVELQDEYEKVINRFLDDINNYFDIKSIEDIKLCSDVKLNPEDYNLEFNDNSNINTLFIINNIEPGSQSIYNEIKKRILTPHKIITLKTILESDEFEIQYILIYLSLKFRNDNKSYLKLKNDDDYILVAFNISKHFNLGYCCIFSSTLINQEHVVNHSFLPLTYNNQSFIEVKASEFILEELKAIKNQVPNKDLIVVYKNILDLKTYINAALKLIQEIYTAEILDMRFKMFKVSNDYIQIPENGSYFIISKTSKHSKICIICNGFPDIPEKGIPNPILLEINSKDDLIISKIMNIFFSHSFLHPTSLIKPNLPIELHQILNIFNLSILSMLNQDSRRFFL